MLRDGSATARVLIDLRFAAKESNAINIPRVLYFPMGGNMQVISGTIRRGIDGD